MSLSLCLIGCGVDNKVNEVEMLHITKAHHNEEGYPVIRFQITNPYEVPICVTESLFEEGSITTYNFGLDIRTKYGRRIMERGAVGYPHVGSKKRLLIAPQSQNTNTLIIERAGEDLIKRLRGRSDLTIKLSFYGGGCTSEEEPLPEPVFLAVSNRVSIQ